MPKADRIKPTQDSIGTYLDNLKNKKYQIPTFQREVVWEEDNVKKLWDSIYKFYPIGSILVWKTGVKLQNYRNIGGHDISDDQNKSEYQYILDGQQRTTSLLTSLYGGSIEGREDFDPTLYVDITISEENDDTYKKRFLFWNDIDDKNGSIKRNIPRRKKYEKNLIVKLNDIKENFNEVEKNIHEEGYVEYDHEYRNNLRNIKNVLDNYRIPFIELKGIEVSEVCEIFERINQEGQALDIFDIVVAKTFRIKNGDKEGFYLRELIDDFRDKYDGFFIEDIDNLTYLQILAIIIRQNIENSGVHNITSRYLNEMEAAQIERVWEDAKKAILKTFDFFENHLHLKGPRLVPFRYFYMSIASYFYKNPDPNYSLLNKYFWFYSFHTEEKLRNTTHLRNHVDWLERAKKGEKVEFPDFVLNKNDLRNSSYSSRGRLSRSILSLLSSQEPKDWKYKDSSVLKDVYYHLTDKPNLHHIFPLNFLDNFTDEIEVNKNSLMNIAYIPQKTNLEISDKNPVNYLKEYNLEELDEVFEDHLIPNELIHWAKKDYLPEDALDSFIEKRINCFVDSLENRLGALNINIIDSKGEGK